MNRIFSAAFFLSLFFISCKGPKTTTKTPVYNDSLYQQFWTADWSPDDNFIAVGGVDSLLRIYHANNLALHKSIPINNWIHSVKWHPNGKVLAIATLDRYVLMLDIETGKMTSLDSKGGSRAIGWNRTGQLLAVGDLDGMVKIGTSKGTWFAQ